MNNKLKIIFLCGSLEPGRDGVGDYTRRLAGEIMKQGHNVALVSLHDHFIAKEIAELQNSQEVVLPVFRIPFAMRAAKRFHLAKEWIDEFNPNWISLQYVPYSYNDKGLPFGLNKQVADLRKGRFLHIMFHELWVGESQSFKTDIYASLQKMMIRQMKKALKPEVTHTHLPYFFEKLKNLKFDVRPLPLFANIPVEKNEKSSNANRVFRVGIFSQTGVDKFIISFLQTLQQAIYKKGMLFELLLIGENNQLKKFGALMEGMDGFKNIVKHTGFLKSAAVSQAIQTCSIGLTSIPRHALGKSGSVAAFLAHGVPVAAPVIECCHNSAEIGFFSDDFRSAILLASDVQDLQLAKEFALAAQDKIQASSIAIKFLSDLSC